MQKKLLVFTIPALTALAAAVVPAAAFDTTTVTSTVTTTVTTTVTSASSGITEVSEFPDNFIISAKRVHLPMENILQLPELPTGCEATALTSLFRFYGYDAEKTDMAKNHLPVSTGNDRYIGKILYRDNFFEYFIGDPFGDGYGCFSPAVVKAANSYITAQKSDMEIVNISGCTPETLYDLLRQGTPVMCWATMDMVPSEYRRSWYDNATGKKLDWYVKEHALILCGYDRENNTVTVNCSLEGIKTYDMTLFETRFREMYSQAVYLKKPERHTAAVQLRNPDPVIATARVNPPPELATTAAPITTVTPPTTAAPVTTVAQSSTAALTSTVNSSTAVPQNTDITSKFPDLAFRKAVRSALRLTDNQPIMSADAAALKKLNLNGCGIANLSGIEYFKNLTYLSCNSNSLRTLPKLPDTLLYLACSGNQLSELPVLPKELTVLIVEGNRLERLPVLPRTLTVLRCGNNFLTRLPALPDTLTELSCSINFLKALPILPNGLKELACSVNPDLDISKVVFKDGSTLLEREAEGTIIIKTDSSPENQH
jgi:uncharacterized protein YvpB